MVGPGTSIPAGFYTIQCDDLTATVYIPNFAVIFTRNAEILLNPYETTILLNPYETTSFTVDPGTYTAGYDFPAGTYFPDPMSDIASIGLFTQDGDLVFNQGMVAENGDRIGQLSAPDSYNVVIMNGSVCFGAPGGVSFE